ncbi:MAG TPA: phosphopantetheine-binding protein [Thermoanaerobaculia bacterium]|nr:phosphopantetheine-binding protein [Thermoanaerobaculia bacterium]
MEHRTDDTAILTRIKDVIAHVAGLDASRIGDEATLREDLNLDSLSLLEIGVDVDYAFQLGLPDERYKEVRSIPDMVALVQERLGELSVGAQAASA